MVYIQCFLLAIALAYAAGGVVGCGSGYNMVEMVNGQRDFDLAFGVSKTNPKKALRGTRSVKVQNGEVLSIDGNNRQFSVMEICVKTMKATEVKFGFFGEENEEQVVKPGVDSQSCAKPPGSEVKAIWITFKNDQKDASFKIKVEDLYMKACIEM